jgi:hypothetical protein
MGCSCFRQCVAAVVQALHCKVSLSLLHTRQHAVSALNKGVDGVYTLERGAFPIVQALYAETAGQQQHKVKHVLAAVAAAVSFSASRYLAACCTLLFCAAGTASSACSLTLVVHTAATLPTAWFGRLLKSMMASRSRSGLPLLTVMLYTRPSSIISDAGGSCGLNNVLQDGFICSAVLQVATLG